MDNCKDCSGVLYRITRSGKLIPLDDVCIRQTSNKPLTQDELRQMDGEPVWVEFQDGSGGVWGIVHLTVFEEIVFPDGTKVGLNTLYFGQVWLAYRRKKESGTI